MTLTPHETAIRAQQLLDDPVVQQILSDLERRYILEWRGTGPGENERRETAHANVRALDDIRAKLSSLASAPKVAAHNNRNAVRR
jgi:hypothetical protein